MLPRSGQGYRQRGTIRALAKLANGKTHYGSALPATS
jgi:hypothetical protein